MNIFPGYTNIYCYWLSIIVDRLFQSQHLSIIFQRDKDVNVKPLLAGYLSQNAYDMNEYPYTLYKWNVYGIRVSCRLAIKKNILIIFYGIYATQPKLKPQSERIDLFSNHHVPHNEMLHRESSSTNQVFLSLDEI